MVTARAKAPAFPLPREADIQSRVRQLFESAGFAVRSTSQVRPSMVAVGLPDLRFHHRTIPGFGGDFETKRPVRRWSQLGLPVLFDPYRLETWFPEGLRPSQRVFRTDAIRAGHLHFFGTDREARAALVVMGFAEFLGPGAEIRFLRVPLPGDTLTTRLRAEEVERARDWLRFVDETSGVVADRKRRRFR